jgi:hypothetical protein
MVESAWEGDAVREAHPIRAMAINPKRIFCMVSLLDEAIVGKLPYKKITQ